MKYHRASRPESEKATRLSIFSLRDSILQRKALSSPHQGLSASLKGISWVVDVDNE